VEYVPGVCVILFIKMDEKADSVGIAVFDFDRANDFLQFALSGMPEWFAGVYEAYRDAEA
jgi:hypothetical protein